MMWTRPLQTTAEKKARSRVKVSNCVGGVVSPILANIFLHHVLDVWFEDEIKSRLSGGAFLVRYADDAVIVIENEEDARRVMNVLPSRFGKYGLTLHPEKTRLVRFKRPQYGSPGKGLDDDDERPGTFAFLGFTHLWGRTRRGGWAVMRITEGKRMRRTLKAITEWCEAARHQPVSEQHKELSSKLRGHDNYYGVPGNTSSLSTLRMWVTRVWQKWLNRRSENRAMPWKRFLLMLERYPLPPPLLSASARVAAKP